MVQHDDDTRRVRGGKAGDGVKALTHGPVNRLPRPTDHRQTTTADLLLDAKLNILGLRLAINAALLPIVDDMIQRMVEIVEAA